VLLDLREHDPQRARNRRRFERPDEDVVQSHVELIDPVESCDGADGAKDGLISDPDACDKTLRDRLPVCSAQPLTELAFSRGANLPFRSLLLRDKSQV
jgi:hypothetical protein